MEKANKTVLDVFCVRWLLLRFYNWKLIEIETVCFSKWSKFQHVQQNKIWMILLSGII